MDLHASGDSVDLPKMPIQTTPKSIHSAKRRSVDPAAGDFDESAIVDEMKKLCNEDNDFDDEPREESVKTDSSESSVDDYKKMIASDSYWSSKLRAQRRVAKRRTPISSTGDVRVRRILADEPSFSQ
ncbi:hypothetical protein PFISCL1PPCAC_2369 [Pristionchus fissidentatus]|uniref:Uncharacterized protein n=1 Tax=Pristionchus fissidentatus TaxID=1538716 RepID=A0AAV5UWV0_9BILA|nr:hypothetical protein PFISCL1PPCAC_2369 [Pristionchus fissidentatus]